MHFLPDIYVPCDVCNGRRYNRETLEVRYKGKNIFEVLDMTAAEALDFFKNLPRLRTKLQTLVDVGLGYVKLGQPSTTLSGGEAQRIKLATELSRKATGRTVYVLDEPTTGLHMADVEKLERVLQQLTDAGNSIVVIEHNLDLIKTADYLIDMGLGRRRRRRHSSRVRHARGHMQVRAQLHRHVPQAYAGRRAVSRAAQLPKRHRTRAAGHMSTAARAFYISRFSLSFMPITVYAVLSRVIQPMPMNARLTMQ